MVISAPKIRKKLPNHHKNVLKIKKNTNRISTKRIRVFFNTKNKYKMRPWICIKNGDFNAVLLFCFKVLLGKSHELFDRAH